MIDHSQMVKFERYCLPLLLLWIVQYQLSFGDYIIEHGEPDDELYDDIDCISGHLETFLIWAEEYTDPIFLDRYMEYIGCAISAGILMKNYTAPPSKRITDSIQELSSKMGTLDDHNPCVFNAEYDKAFKDKIVDPINAVVTKFFEYDNDPNAEKGDTLAKSCSSDQTPVQIFDTFKNMTDSYSPEFAQMDICGPTSFQYFFRQSAQFQEGMLKKIIYAYVRCEITVNGVPTEGVNATLNSTIMEYTMNFLKAAQLEREIGDKNDLLQADLRVLVNVFSTPLQTLYQEKDAGITVAIISACIGAASLSASLGFGTNSALSPADQKMLIAVNDGIKQLLTSIQRVTEEIILESERVHFRDDILSPLQAVALEIQHFDLYRTNDSLVNLIEYCEKYDVQKILVDFKNMLPSLLSKEAKAGGYALDNWTPVLNLIKHTNNTLIYAYGRCKFSKYSGEPHMNYTAAVNETALTFQANIEDIIANAEKERKESWWDFNAIETVIDKYMAKCKLSTCTQQAIQSYLNINYKEFGYYFAVVLIQNIGEVLTKTLDESGGHLFNVNVWQKYYLPYFVGIQRYKEGSVLAQSRCNPEDVLNFDTTCILVASNSYNYVYSQMTQRIAERCNYGAFIIIISNFKSSRPTAVLDSSAKVFSIFTNCGPFNAYDWYITVYLAGS